MKSYYHTKIDEVFNLQEVVTIYSRKNVSCKCQSQVYDFWQIMFVLKGVFYGRVEEKRYCVEAGESFLRAPGEVHICENIEELPCEIGIISFSSNSGLLEWFRGKICKLSYEEKGLRDEALRVGEAIFSRVEATSEFRGFKPNDNASNIELHFLKNTVERMLLSIYSRLSTADLIESGNSNKNKAFTEKVKKYLSENLCDRVTLDDIAKHFAVSRSSLKYIFKEVTGMSVIRYHNVLIMEEVKRCLRKNDTSLTNIAEQFGFCSLDYFSKKFKRYTGVTPSEYRRNVFFDE